MFEDELVPRIDMLKLLFSDERKMEVLEDLKSSIDCLVEEKALYLANLSKLLYELEGITKHADDDTVLSLTDAISSVDYPVLQDIKRLRSS